MFPENTELYLSDLLELFQKKENADQKEQIYVINAKNLEDHLILTSAKEREEFFEIFETGEQKVEIFQHPLTDIVVFKNMRTYSSVSATSHFVALFFIKIHPNGKFEILLSDFRNGLRVLESDFSFIPEIGSWVFTGYDYTVYRCSKNSVEVTKMDRKISLKVCYFSENGIPTLNFTKETSYEYYWRGGEKEGPIVMDIYQWLFYYNEKALLDKEFSPPLIVSKSNQPKKKVEVKHPLLDQSKFGKVRFSNEGIVISTPTSLKRRL
jgi:hypothetical protein